VASDSCWHQSRYRFIEPSSYKKAIIGTLFGICFLIGIIFLAVETYQDRKARREMLAERENLENLNQNVAIDDDADLQGAMSELQRHRRRIRRPVGARRG
jgi:hypothetical protein